MQALIVISLIFFGLCFGSFMGAQVWRLRARQLEETRQAGEEYDKTEYKRLKPLVSETLENDRSRCLGCGHRLAWYDLIPLMSWLSTGGRCRYCKQPIGRFEPLMELGMAAFFVVSYLAWPVPLDAWSLDLAAFVVWLVVGVLLIGLFAYDAKWFLLPDTLVFPAMVLAAVMAEIRVVQSDDTALAALSLNGAVLILSGLYLAVYVLGERFGKRWIGFGDVKLGLVLALMLADWPLALLALFLANLIGCVIILPLLWSGKLSRTTPVPFGPLLIIGFFIAGLFGQGIIDWYLTTSMMLV